MDRFIWTARKLRITSGAILHDVHVWIYSFQAVARLPTGTRRSIPPQPLPFHAANVNGGVQLRPFTAEARTDNAEDKPGTRAGVLALCRFCFLYSLLFLLPGCLTSYSAAENVQERCIVPPSLCRIGVRRSFFSPNLYVSDLKNQKNPKACSLGYIGPCEGQESFYLFIYFIGIYFFEKTLVCARI